MVTTQTTTTTHRADIMARTAGAGARVRALWRHVAVSLALVGSLAGTVQATDLRLDPTRFFLRYQVRGLFSPEYQILPMTTGAFPFNTAKTPFLLPCAVQKFGGQLQVDSVPPGDSVYANVRIRFIQSDGTVIVSQGFGGTTPPFDFVDANLSGLLAPGESEEAGYTPINAVDPQFRPFLYQPQDLPANRPVYLELTVMPFTDPQFTQSAVDANPDNDVINLWVMRVCPLP